MSDDNEKTEAYPGHGPHSDGPSGQADYSDPVEKEVEDRFPVTPGTESSEERKQIADERVAKLDAARQGGDPIEKPAEDDDEPELSDESDDDEPVQPADDSPVHGEDTVKPGDPNPAL